MRSNVMNANYRLSGGDRDQIINVQRTIQFPAVGGGICDLYVWDVLHSNGECRLNPELLNLSQALKVVHGLSIVTLSTRAHLRMMVSAYNVYGS